jgi:hypothetical protein
VRKQILCARPRGLRGDIYRIFMRFPIRRRRQRKGVEIEDDGKSRDAKMHRRFVQHLCIAEMFLLRAGGRAMK